MKYRCEDSDLTTIPYGIIVECCPEPSKLQHWQPPEVAVIVDRATARANTGLACYSENLVWTRKSAMNLPPVQLSEEELLRHSQMFAAMFEKIPGMLSRLGKNNHLKWAISMAQFMISISKDASDLTTMCHKAGILWDRRKSIDLWSGLLSSVDQVSYASSPFWQSRSPLASIHVSHFTFRSQRPPLHFAGNSCKLFSLS